MKYVEERERLTEDLLTDRADIFLSPQRNTHTHLKAY